MDLATYIDYTILGNCPVAFSVKKFPDSSERVWAKRLLLDFIAVLM
jgi:hypothetical protein